MADAPDYLRVLGTSALNGVATAAWVATGELPAGRRRAARVALTTVTWAVAWAALPPAERPFTWSREDGFAMVKPAEVDPARPEPVHRPINEMSRGRVALSMGMVAFGLAKMVGGRKLEKHWLAGLQRAGHPRPYLGLAWRVGLLNAAGSLPANVFELKRARDRAARVRSESR